MPKRYVKFKLLLDENLPPRRELPRLNERYDVKHVAEDLHRGGIEDQDVYELAVAQKRVLLTYNVKHFKPLAGMQADQGIIGLPPNVPRVKLDSKLVALLSRTAPKTLRGHYVSLSAEEN
jgi:hypothetical protein